MYCAGIYLHNDILCVGIRKLEEIVKVKWKWRNSDYFMFFVHGSS